MRLMRARDFHHRFPSGDVRNEYAHVSVFSAVPCVLPAPDALRAFPRRTFPSATPTSLARRGRFSLSIHRNTDAQ